MQDNRGSSARIHRQEERERPEASTVDEYRRELDHVQLWEQAKAYFLAELSEVHFSMYFASASVLPAQNASVLTLLYSSEFLADWCRDTYGAVIEEVLLRQSGVRLKVRYQVDPDLDATAKAAESGKASENAPQGVGQPASPGKPPKPSPSPAANLRSPSANSTSRSPQNLGHSQRSEAGSFNRSPGLRLSDQNTFETFVTGGSNALAAAASQAVARDPGQAYNPLFLHGGVGLGKTHLMQAAGNCILERNPSFTLRYVTSEQFTNEFVDSIKRNKPAEFRARYRSCDVLLIDDIQFISGKVATQEELFHTFNDLHQQGKQIIFTSDAPPAELTKLEERLLTRFQWGLVADIQPPEHETRMAILQSKADRMGLVLNPEVIEYIARHVRSNVRELEGSLKRLEFFREVSSEPLTVDTCKSALRSLLANRGEQVDVDNVIRTCAEHFGVTVAEIRSPVRSRHIARARQAAMYLSRTLLNTSFPELGRKFDRDHSTVITAVKRVEQLVKKDEDYCKSVEILERQLMRNL